MSINKNFVRYFAYSLEIILLFVLQSTPKLMPVILGNKPLLLVALAFVIASKESFIPSLIFGAVCGAVTDIAGGGGVGFFAVALTLLCYYETYIFKSKIVSSFLSTLIYSAICVTLLICLYFVLFRLYLGTELISSLFINHYLSKIIYTIIMVIPLYGINTYLHKNLFER